MLLEDAMKTTSSLPSNGGEVGKKDGRRGDGTGWKGGGEVGQDGRRGGGTGWKGGMEGREVRCGHL